MFYVAYFSHELPPCKSFIELSFVNYLSVIESLAVFGAYLDCGTHIALKTPKCPSLDGNLVEELVKPKILVIDDDNIIRETMKLYQNEFGFEVDTAENGVEGIRLIEENPGRYACAFIDYQLGEVDYSTGGFKTNDRYNSGLNVSSDIRNLDKDIVLFIISGVEDKSPLLAKAADSGVQNVISKPFTTEFIRDHIMMAVNFYSSPLDRKRSDISLLNKFEMIGSDDKLARACDLALKSAVTDFSVFILGSTGTGKELIAKGIHKNSRRASKPFVTIDCTEYKDNTALMSSDLFGHEKGAFTDAKTSKPGKLELASGGTVFLDELHHLGPSAQAKLLRAIEVRKASRVGSTKEYAFNVRFISAAKPSIKDMVSDRSFSPDLWYRLANLDIYLPDLKERPDDVEILLEHFKNVAEERDGKAKQFSPGAIKILKSYSWPGNVRELKGLVDKLFITTDGHIIGPSKLPSEICDKSMTISSDTMGDDESLGAELLETEHAFEQVKLKLYLKALLLSDGDKSATAKLLGKSRGAVRSFITKHNLDALTKEQMEMKLKVASLQSVKEGV